MLPARTSIGIRAWINLFVAEIAYCSGKFFQRCLVVCLHEECALAFPVDRIGVVARYGMAGSNGLAQLPFFFCAGRVQEGLKAAQEAMRLSSALLHGLGLRVSTADRQKGSSTAVRPLDAISSGMGHWQALFLQLCSLLLVGQHCDAAGSWTEAEGALRFGMQQVTGCCL